MKIASATIEISTAQALAFRRTNKMQLMGSLDCSGLCGCKYHFLLAVCLRVVRSATKIDGGDYLIMVECMISAEILYSV